MGQGHKPYAQPSTWRTRGSLFVWSLNDNSANFSGEKKYNERIPGCLFFDITPKNFQSNLVLVVVHVVLVLESKALYSVSMMVTL